jgi:hypothetical protein
VIYAVKDAAVAAPVDPLLILLTALGGALVAAAAGFIGAWLQGRREHEKWIRERRFEAYTRYMQVAQRWNVRLSAKIDGNDEEFLDEMVAAEAEIDLLGPKAVRDLMDDIRAALLAWERLNGANFSDHSAATWEKFRAFEEAAQVALKIKA